MVNTGNTAVTDFSALARMRADAREDGGTSDENQTAVARQFESLFIHMMVKQMRQSGLSEGMFDSKQSEMYREMYDQQLSSNLAENGGLGLAEVIKRQLGGQPLIPELARGHADYQAAPTQRAPMLKPATLEVPRKFAGPEDFIERLRPHAEAAAQRLGLPAEALLAQAALETGWGRASMETRNGQASHNLFGIKADRRWSGDRATVQTLEYQEGIAVKTRADFRAYGSYAESFNDYVRFVSDNPRYRDAIDAAHDPQAYFHALQKAGYATDPAYADKVLSILQRPELQVSTTTAATRQDT